MELLIVWTAAAVLAGIAAQSKARNVIGWAALCFLLSPLALIVLALLPPLTEQTPVTPEERERWREIQAGAPRLPGS